MPTVPIYVSTGTPTGRKLAEERLAGVASAVFRAPLDLPWCVAKVFANLRPRLLIITETEIWPSLFFQAKRFGVATMIVNGRISDRSAPKYRRLRFAFRDILKCVDLILAQSEEDRDRFIDAGASRTTASVGGNLKYDFDPDAELSELPADLRNFIDAASPGLVLVAGSTREGEEAALTPALRRVVARVRRTLLVVAPRHPERFAEAGRALAALGLPVLRRSRLPGRAPPDLPSVLLLDSLGELAGLYRRADLVFVGGSLNGWGGHNVLEPVSFSKAVVVGPYMQNFRDIAAGLRAAGGLVQVHGADELETALPSLAADAAGRAAIGRRGREFADSQRGATNRAAEEARRLYGRAIPRVPPTAARYAALRIPAALWSTVAGARRWGFATGLLASRELPIPVVSVGNLTAGGTGKTPTVAWLVERLWEEGYTAGVLTRGYGRDEKRRLILVESGTSADPVAVGDEPAMLARRFAKTAPRTVIAVHRDRHTGGRALANRGGFDVLVMDDGFQHMQLRRMLNIVLLDATAPFDHGYALPLGMLREPVGSLWAADIVLLTRCEAGLDDSGLREAVHAVSPQADVIRSRMVTTGLVGLNIEQSAPLDSLTGASVAAFCGVGNPDSFFGAVRSLGCGVAARCAFPDHHRYSEADRRELNRVAIDRSAQLILTTEKDAMNLGGTAEFRLPVFALRVELQVEQEEEFLMRLLPSPEGSRKEQALPTASRLRRRTRRRAR